MEQDIKLIEDAFYKRFQGYDCSFESQETKVQQMPTADRNGYYLKAKDLVENQAFISEIREWKRKLYTELALRSNNDLERQGYRMTLLAIQDFETRLNKLASMYGIKPLRTLQDKL